MAGDPNAAIADDDRSHHKIESLNNQSKIVNCVRQPSSGEWVSTLQRPLDQQGNLRREKARQAEGTPHYN